MGTVYRAVSDGYRGESEVLGCRMKRKGVGFAALLTSLQILSEGGLLHVSDDGFVLCVEAAYRREQAGKISPENTPSAVRVGYKNV